MSHSESTSIALAVVEHQGRVLIGKRPAWGPLPGLWEFPGGKVEPGETPEQAAARECLEETGLAVRIGALYLEEFHAYEHGLLRLGFYAAEPMDPSQTPAGPFCWVPAAELPGYEFPPANSALIRVLLDGFSR